MGRITLQDLTVHEVELPGDLVYTVKPATRAVVTQASDVEKRLEQTFSQETDEVTPEQLDAVVALYGEVLDLRLQPAAPRQAKASAAVTKLWKSNQVTIPQLEQLLAGISETDRPT